MAAVSLTDDERVVHRLWKDGGQYRGFGVCPGCGDFGYLCGTTPGLKICVVCFEFVYGCKFPRRRRTG